MLEHGGRLRAAAAHYGIPLEHWLDLSTGINPQGYVLPAIPDDAWWRLPQDEDGLGAAAAAYYGTPDTLPVAGSQAALQALPRLRARCRVGVLHPGYAEHAHAWRNAGHEVVLLGVDEIEARLDECTVLVLMNPNNPTGAMFPPERLRGWHARLAARGGWLVVDEAFIEAVQQDSLAQAQMPQGLIVLRSLGKFFGLAGARVGFVLAHASLCDALRELLGPWAVCGPARFVAQAALRDHTWQSATRIRLLRDGERLAQLLGNAGLVPSGGCGLFQWVRCARAATLHGALAQHGILTRHFLEPDSLRFGLPAAEADWQRLAAALVTQECTA
jgi:cobalamin biosynthetic protein CobC